MMRVTLIKESILQEKKKSNHLSGEMHIPINLFSGK